GGDPLALRVEPDVDFGPVQQRMNADMCAGRKIGLVLVPEFRRLILEVPLSGKSTWAEDAFLCSGCFFVAANTGKERIEAMLLDRKLETFCLAGGRPGGRRQGVICCFQRRAKLPNEVQPPL